MKILLHENSLNIRGTSTAVYDYALFLKKIYNYDCCITYNPKNEDNSNSIIEKFKTSFEVIPHSNFTDVENIISNNNIDLLYIIKSGGNDGKVSKNVKTCVHAVFPNDISQSHGDVYAYVSSWLSQFCSNNTIPYVPHMINLPNVEGNLRYRLNIPDDAIVFGRYGGYDTFDIQFVRDVIKKLLEVTTNTYFLFCNTPVFINDPRVIFTNNITKPEDKVAFINTCDALLHARYQGETFGLTVIEFMYRQKPIYTYGLSHEKNHYELLNGQGYLYDDANQLFESLISFKPHNVEYAKLDEFAPNKVMEKFHETFIL